MQFDLNAHSFSDPIRRQFIPVALASGFRRRKMLVYRGSTYFSFVSRAELRPGPATQSQLIRIQRSFDSTDGIPMLILSEFNIELGNSVVHRTVVKSGLSLIERPREPLLFGLHLYLKCFNGRARVLYDAMKEPVAAELEANDDAHFATAAGRDVERLEGNSGLPDRTMGLG